MSFYNKYIAFSNSYLQNSVVRNIVKNNYHKYDNLDSQIEEAIKEINLYRERYLEKKRDIQNCKVKVKKIKIKASYLKYKLNQNGIYPENKEVAVNTERIETSDKAQNTSTSLESRQTNTSPINNYKVSKSLKLIVKDENKKSNKTYYTNSSKASINNRMALNKN